MNSILQAKPRGMIENALVLLLLFVLLVHLYSVLSVFLGVFTYAVIFSVSFSGLFESMVIKLKNRRKLAAFIYAILLIGLIAVPFMFIIRALNSYATDLHLQLAAVKNTGLPAPPQWLVQVPFIGEKIEAFWQELRADPSNTISAYEPQIKAVLQRVISGGAGMIGASLEFLVGIIISAVLLAGGEKILQPVYAAMANIAGTKDGPLLVDAAGRAVKGVAVGVMGTAFVAALFAWIGFAIAGISFAVGLAALTFFLVVIQLGPLLVWLPVAIWLSAQGQTGWAIFIAVYGLVVLMGIDNILKPVLIAKSGKLPVLVLFLGVIGGMVAWGFTGMFKGAIILAVFYTIFNAWLARSKQTVEVVTIDPYNAKE